MKRRILALFLAALTALTLTTAALADEEANGAYNVQSKNGYTFSVVGTNDGGFYAGADTFTLTCPSTSGETLVYLVEGTDKLPTEENLQYIDQSGTDKTFTLKPKELKADTTYRVYVSTENAAPKEAGAFSYGKRPTYTLGDVNNDGKINSSDALLILQSAVGKITLSATQTLAADVNKDGKINSSDALKVLQYAVGKITSFD